MVLLFLECFLLLLHLVHRVACTEEVKAECPNEVLTFSFQGMNLNILRFMSAGFVTCGCQKNRLSL